MLLPQFKCRPPRHLGGGRGSRAKWGSKSKSWSYKRHGEQWCLRFSQVSSHRRDATRRLIQDPLIAKRAALIVPPLALAMAGMPQHGFVQELESRPTEGMEGRSKWPRARDGEGGKLDLPTPKAAHCKPDDDNLPSYIPRKAHHLVAASSAKRVHSLHAHHSSVLTGLMYHFSRPCAG